MSNENIRIEVNNYFNEKCGKDLLDPNKCKEIFRKFQSKKEFLISELNLNNETSNLKKVVKKVDETVAKVEDLLVDSKNINVEIGGQLDKVDEIRKTVQEYCDKINILETAIQYMKVVQKIEFLSLELQKEITNKDDEKCATYFANICEISRNLTGLKAEHLCKYLKGTLHHWHEILKEKFLHDFDEVLKTIKWPFVSANFSLQSPSQNNIKKLQIITEYLLQIELPEESAAFTSTSGLLSNFPQLSLPIYYLVLPLRKRFIYHFHGTKQTNRIDKPEWYFTQILSWIRDHVDFVGQWIQPIIDKLGLHHIDAKVELMRGLVQLAVEKLHADMPNLQFDDYIFSHSIDEALGFDKELRDSYFYPANQPGILVVLTQAQVFSKWLMMEKKYATEKMDMILSASNTEAFNSLELEADDFKVTHCANAFVTLLQTMTERYESLPQPGHRLQFLELQLEILDDFRVRLLQLTNAETGDVIESKIPMIANTVFYIENVLIDWGAMLHFLNLYYYKTQLETIESNVPVDFQNIPDFEFDTETVFADILSLYRHMRRDLLSTLVEAVMMEIKARSRAYRNDKWSSMTNTLELRSLSLTPTACPMFEILARRLHQLQKYLAQKLFGHIWKQIAEQLDNFLFEDLVLDNRFNQNGALQLKYDVTKNLFPLFAQYTDKPDNYFTKLKESCNLLNISKGSALLLRETLLALEGATGVEDRRGDALKEVGVENFTPKMAVAILNRRSDIPVYRMVID